MGAIAGVHLRVGLAASADAPASAQALLDRAVAALSAPA